MPTKMKDYQGMSDEQLALTLKDTEKHMFQLRFQSATDRLETPSEIRKARKEIARIRTVQRLRELAEFQRMPAEQLAPRVSALAAKAAQGGPGKRTIRRKLQRLQALHGAKTTAKPALAQKGTK